MGIFDGAAAELVGAAAKFVGAAAEFVGSKFVDPRIAPLYSSLGSTGPPGDGGEAKDWSDCPL